MIRRTRREAMWIFAAGAGSAAAPGGWLLSKPARAAEDTLARIRREKRIRLGFFNQAPWATLNADGTATGEAPDVVRAALAPLGVATIEPVVAEFAAMIPGLLADRFDAVATGLYINPARCKLVLFGNPDIQMGDAFLVKAGNPIDLHSYGDLAKRTDFQIGVNRGSVLIQYIDAAGVHKDRVVLFPDNQAALAGLQAGRVAVVAGTAASVVNLIATAKDPGIERATPFAGWHDEKGQEVKGYPGTAFRPADAALRDAYNDGLRELRSSGGLLAILRRHGFGESELPPENLTAAQLCG
jgi:polar amino acid transport system substrate-binding protein